MQNGINHYEILQVSPHATPEVIKAAYRTLSKVMHPDAGGSPELASALNKAYEVISDASSRSRYDLELRLMGETAPGGRSGEPQVKEVFVALCLQCKAVNRLPRIDAIFFSTCTRCSEPFDVEPVARSSTSQRYQASEPTKSWSDRNTVRYSRAQAQAKSWVQTPQRDLGNCGHQLSFFAGGMLDRALATFYGIEEWSGAKLCGECWKALRRIE